MQSPEGVGGGCIWDAGCTVEPSGAHLMTPMTNLQHSAQTPTVKSFLLKALKHLVPSALLLPAPSVSVDEVRTYEPQSSTKMYHSSLLQD